MTKKAPEASTAEIFPRQPFFVALLHVMVDKMELLVTEICGIEEVAEAHHHAVCVRV
jgi:hypothetical protein